MLHTSAIAKGTQSLQFLHHQIRTQSATISWDHKRESQNHLRRLGSRNHLRGCSNTNHNDAEKSAASTLSVCNQCLSPPNILSSPNLLLVDSTFSCLHQDPSCSRLSPGIHMPRLPPHSVKGIYLVMQSFGNSRKKLFLLRGGIIFDVSRHPRRSPGSPASAQRLFSSPRESTPQVTVVTVPIQFPRKN